MNVDGHGGNKWIDQRWGPPKIRIEDQNVTWNPHKFGFAPPEVSGNFFTDYYNLLDFIVVFKHNKFSWTWGWSAL